MGMPRWVVAVVALLFVIGAAYNFTLGHDRTDAVWGLVVGLLLGAIYVYARREERLQRQFLVWLKQNAEAVHAGGAVYRDVTITRDTVVRQFGVCMSALVVSFRTRSRHLIVGHDAVALTGIVSTVASLLLGWWGIPWGPVYTVMVAARNLRGGSRQTVGELLDQLAMRRQAAAA
jgi:hypothetical protein